MKNIDPLQRYDSADAFFMLGGSVIMKLSADAAITVCTTAADYGLVVTRVEGGVWHHPGFEARVDCIWDGVDPPVTLDALEQNNREASAFISTERSEHDVFVLTTQPA